MPRILLVGCGHMGRLHRAALERCGHMDLCGLVDPCGLVGERRLPVFSTLEEALWESRAQAAILAAPTSVHRELALRCARAGLHVLLEKPLCPTGLEARELERVFRERDLVLMGGHVESFNPAFLELERRCGQVGVLKRLKAVRRGGWPRDRSAGPGLDLMVHDLDLCLRLAGGDGRILSSSLSRGDQVRLQVRLECASACPAHLEAVWGADREDSCRLLEVEGDAGILRADLAARRLWWKRSGGLPEECPVAAGDALEAQHEAFARAQVGAWNWKEPLHRQVRAVELATGAECSEEVGCPA